MIVTDMYPLVQSQPFELAPSGEASVDLELKRVPPTPFAQLSGTVTASNPGALGGATVKVMDIDYNPIAHTVTDSEGRYQFNSVLSPGLYRVTAAAAGYSTAATQCVCLKNAVPVTINFQLNKDSMSGCCALYGIVHTLDFSVPIANVRLILYDLADVPIDVTESNAQGNYLFTAVMPDQYILTAGKPGFSPVKVMVTAEENAFINCDITLVRDAAVLLGTISGLIRNHAYCSSSNVVIGLYRLDNANETLVQIGRTNEEGLYLFADVEPGSYRVKATLQKGIAYQQEFKI